MLTALSVRDVVLIERLDLELRGGLSALTGETGAGKSILLDALGLALGERSDAGLLRAGRDQATVTAAFELAREHPARAQLAERGLPDEDLLVLRRVVARDGRSRAFINDEPVGVAALREIGAALVEIHGQNAERGLLDPSGHRALLDAFGGLRQEVEAVRLSYRQFAAGLQDLAALQAATEAGRAEEEFDRAALAELAELDPQLQEEASLAEERAFLSSAEKLTEDVDAAARLVGGEKGAADSLGGALRRLERAAARSGGRLDEACAAVNRALVEVQEAEAALSGAMQALDFDPRRLEAIEERLFALRAAARKYRVASADELPRLHAEIQARLDAVESGEARLAEAVAAVEAARHDYRLAAKVLSAARRLAAGRLEQAVAAELAPLKLDRAGFRVRIDALPEDEAGAEGLERVGFEVSTNPGAPFGALARIASGGELARFVLALKVALAAQGSAVTLVFDEVDQGVGGAVATAVGERLARLGQTAQVLVVTHSPQVAAKARHHLRIEKAERSGAMITWVEELAPDGRREEIARMLAGAEVTEEARAAACRLLEGAPA